MTRAVSFRPILPVADIDAATAHYKALGFRVRRYGGGGYAFAVRDDAHFDMTVKPGHWYGEGSRVVVYMDVEDADALFTEWSTANVGGVTEPPVDLPWGMREGTHTDPDGNVIRYGAAMDDDATSA